MFCEECQREFTPNRCTQVLCGRKACRDSRRKKYQKETRAAAKAEVLANTLPIPCKICGDMFIPQGRWLATCGPTCSKLNESVRDDLIKEPIKGIRRLKIPTKYLVRGNIGADRLGSQIDNGNPGGGI